MSADGRSAYCGQCGNAVEPGDRFCGACGGAVLAPPPRAEQVIPRPVATAQGAGYGGGRRTRMWVNAAMISLIVLLGVGAVAAFALNDKLGLLGASDQRPADNREIVPPQPETAQDPTTPDPAASGSPSSDPSEPPWMSDEEIASLEEFGREYDEAVRREDWEETYEMLDESSRQEVTEEEWAEKQQTLAGTNGTPAPLEEVSVTQDEEATDVPVDVNLNYEDGTQETIVAGIPMAVEDPADARVPKRYLTDAEVSELEAPLSAEPESTTAYPGGQSIEETAAAVEEAAGDYYRAAGVGDWSYTHEKLDSDTQSKFTEEEWFGKNQYFASNGEVIYDIDSVYQTGTSTAYWSVVLTLTYEDGTSSTRTTYFVYEGGEWKHRFGQEENDLFMPDATFEEFVEAQVGGSS